MVGTVSKSEKEPGRLELDFAPLEGITGYPFRRAHARCFPGADRYFTPFIAANGTHSFKTREKKEIDPAHNAGLRVIPQILTNDAEAFLWAAGEMKERGYDEVNLNLGCPSPTVVTRRKGAGFLGEPEKLDRFFEAVFEGLAQQDVRISVKTRIGMASEAETGELIEIYNRYPLAEVIVHPRLRTDFYKGEPRMESFERFYAELCHPVLYNGDVRTARDAGELRRRFPKLRGIMIGRGLLMDPALIREIRGAEAAFGREEAESPAGGELTRGELRHFHDEVLAGWMSDMDEWPNVIGKMKELWYYMGPLFADGGRELKKIRKARQEAEYRAAVDMLFSRRELIPAGERTWRP